MRKEILRMDNVITEHYYKTNLKNFNMHIMEGEIVGIIGINGNVITSYSIHYTKLYEAKAFRAKKHIQDYVFTDGTAEKSVERRFAEDMDKADEVCVV